MVESLTQEEYRELFERVLSKITHETTERLKGAKPIDSHKAATLRFLARGYFELAEEEVTISESPDINVKDLLRLVETDYIKECSNTVGRVFLTDMVSRIRGELSKDTSATPSQIGR